jgi:periplasmic divalent cation tolerance protein
MESDGRIILSTVASREEAERLASHLVTERLAACVNIVPGVVSLYWWNDAIQRDEELLLVIKTVEHNVEALRQRLSTLHPYELPEFLVLKPSEISPQYQTWLNESTRT